MSYAATAAAYGDDATDLAVLTRIAESTLHGAGDLAGARAHFHRAVDEATRSADTEHIARAALGLGGVWVNEHRSAVERLQVLEIQRGALRMLEPDSALSFQLRARITAEEAYAAGEAGRVLAVLDEARARNDDHMIATALSLAHHCMLGPQHAAARLQLADELIAVSARTGRAIDALLGLAWRTVDLYLSGDARADRALRELQCRLEHNRFECVEYVVAALEVMRAIRDGRLEEAEELAGACCARGRAVGDADATGWYGAQLVAIRWYQGRTAEILPLVADLAHSPTLAEPNHGFFAALAVVAAAAGHVDEARAALAHLRLGGLASTPQSSTWMASIAGAIEAAALIGDDETAREGYELLLPFAEYPVMASLAVACFGSAHRVLGRAALAFGDHDIAVRHFEAAVVADLRIGNRAAHAQSCAQLADARARRATRRDAASAADATTVTCARDGKAWRVTDGARVCSVAHSVGMEYLAQLLAQPGVELRAVDLASAHGVAALASVHAVLDDTAIAAYRHRAAALQEEMDEADHHADLERAARARLELDEIVDELARATGLAGRSREFHDDAERARTSVQKAIKRAMVAITSADGVLGEHLHRSITTGVRCCYKPARRL